MEEIKNEFTEYDQNSINAAIGTLEYHGAVIRENDQLFWGTRELDQNSKCEAIHNHLKWIENRVDSQKRDKIEIILDMNCVEV